MFQGAMKTFQLYMLKEKSIYGESKILKTDVRFRGFTTFLRSDISKIYFTEYNNITSDHWTSKNSTEKLVKKQNELFLVANKA